ncbi:proteasome protein [Serinibacter arcticus]|uniref:Proteasome protein n=2 Tax=Serinibacter arcticus TaxID=1655435 RepID=A0A2U1ZST1_9MICO|nr:proteasome protein [Serinibacter arcticus]
MYRWDLDEVEHGVRPGGDGTPVAPERDDATAAPGATSPEIAPGPDPRPTAATDDRAVADVVFGAEHVSRPRHVPTTLDGARASVLVHAMRGGMDAGSAGSLVASHLLASHPTTRVATFDIDELMDYRSRRPTMTFSSPRYTDYDDPVLALDHVATPQGGVLLLHGPEPDLRWEAFSRAVREIVERLGVSTTVGVHGVPMGVPHTRPIGVTAHASREELVDPQPDIFGTVQIPGSASALVEYRLGQWGHDAMGFAVHVPHYLAQAQYPAAASELVRSISRVTGEELDTSALDEAAAVVAVEVDRQIADSPDVAALVEALENQYDAFQEAAGRSLLASTEVPSADELGAQFEAFLAEQADSDREDDGGGSAGR